MNTYNFSSGFAALGVLTIVGWCIALIVLFVLCALIRWKIFTKAGEAGWKSLIPIYGDFIEYKLMWNPKWFWIYLGCSAGGSAFMWIPIIGPSIFIAAMIVSMLIKTVFALQEAKAFNQSTGFGVGLLMVPFVFQFLMAFDNNIQYVEPQSDPAVFNNAKESLKKDNNVKPAMRFDPYTGEPIYQPEQTMDQKAEEAVMNAAINRDEPIDTKE